MQPLTQPKGCWSSENMKGNGWWSTSKTWFGRSEWKWERKSQIQTCPISLQNSDWSLCFFIKATNQFSLNTNWLWSHSSPLERCLGPKVRLKRDKKGILGPHVIWANGGTKVKSISQIRPTLPGGQPRPASAAHCQKHKQKVSKQMKQICIFVEDRGYLVSNYEEQVLLRNKCSDKCLYAPSICETCTGKDWEKDSICFFFLFQHQLRNSIASPNNLKIKLASIFCHGLWRGRPVKCLKLARNILYTFKKYNTRLVLLVLVLETK